MDCLNVEIVYANQPVLKRLRPARSITCPPREKRQKLFLALCRNCIRAKNPGLSVCVLTSELEARKVSHARRKRAKNLTHALQKIICPVCLQTCLCLASFIALHEWLQREELNHAQLDRCATNFDARHFMTLQADRGYWKLRSLP